MGDINNSAEGAFFFVSKKANCGGQLNTKEQLHKALCLAGRNPTLKFIDSVWDGSSINFSSFSSILDKCESISEEKLTTAFSKLSPKKKKSMSKNQLLSILSSCGESLTQKEVTQFLDSMIEMSPGIIDNNGEIAYNSLIKNIMKTANDAKQKSVEFYEHSKASPLKKMARNSASGSARRRRSSISLSKTVEVPNDLEHWVESSVNGAFFFDDDDETSIISHQYRLTVPHNSSSYITMKSTLHQFEDETQAIDTRLAIMADGDNSVKLVAFTHDRNDQNEYICRTELKAGTYTIIPFTTGCRFVPKAENDPSSIDLVKMVDGKPVLLEQFLSALKKIFKIIDADGNNLLSRQEFNLFNWRTSGEEVADDEWAVVQDNFELENGELTLHGFLDLHQMEAEDSNGEDDDLWVTLHSMGFNNSLKLHQICPFQISVYSPEESMKFEVSGIRSVGPATTKAIAKFVIDHGYSNRIENSQDLSAHQLSTKNWSCIVLQNKSQSAVTVSVDCSESSNCISHIGQLKHAVSVPPKSVAIAHHLMPIFDGKPWKVKFSELIVT